MRNVIAIAFFWVVSAAAAQSECGVESVVAFQSQLNADYANRQKSPLAEPDFVAFKSHDYFPANEKYCVVGTFIRTENEAPFEMKTSTERRPLYRKFAVVTFVIDGKPYKLNVYQNIELSKKEGFEDYLFLPFSDLTCGKDSYIGGRYIDLRMPQGDKIIVDFNKAYNPYCAYNHKYSCPIVPLENDLSIDIKAGVKKFHD